MESTMRTDGMKLKRSQVALLLDTTFPEYTGRKIKVVFEESITFFNTNRDGGSRNTYIAIRRDGALGYQHIPAPWINRTDGTSMKLAADVMVVNTPSGVAVTSASPATYILS